MIITDRFVYIHQPKTGGTFVTEVLSRLYQLKNTDARENRYGGLTRRRKHHPCRKIREADRGKQVLATFRNPYDWYVSQYEFGWWKKEQYLNKYRDRPGFDQRFPTFPDIEFADYVELVNGASVPAAADAVESLGALTIEFIRFYFKDPAGVFSRIDEEYFASGRYRSDMFDVHFIHTDCLNRELHDFLLGAGYAAEDISFILGLGKIRPETPAEGQARADHQRWEDYYTPELKRVVRRRERHLFTVFPEFDV
jgi:hypothetical protein